MKPRTQRTKYLAWTALCLVSLVSAPAQSEIRRVVSLNPCLDVILVNVADREQIAALSHYARDADSSTIFEIASTFPVIYESAEEVLALEPDLVLTSRHSDLATRNVLRRLDIKTELFNEPKTLAESLNQIRVIAGLVNRVERGDALIAKIEEALRMAEPEAGTPLLSALVFQRNGFSTGSGTLVHEMLERTGYRNAGWRYGLSGWGNIPLERVIADPPEVLLAGEILPNVPTWADRVVRHPALRNIGDRMKRATFPDRLIYCGGPVLIESVKTLMSVRLNILDQRP